jgi:hypothetical protein
MAIARTAVGTVAQASSGTNITPGIPAGTALNDILVCVSCHGAGGDVLSFNANDGSWTKKIELANGTQHKLTIAWRRASGSEGAPTISGHTQDIQARITGYSGCTTSGDPFSASNSQNNAASTTVTAPGITPGTSTDMVVFAGCQSDTGAGLAVFSAYSGTDPTFTEAVNNNFGGSVINPAIFLADGLTTDGAATGNRTATSTTNLISTAALLSLTQAGGGAVVVPPVGGFIAPVLLW